MQLRPLTRPSRNSLIGTPISKPLSLSPSITPFTLPLSHFLHLEPNPLLKLQFSKSPTRHHTHILRCISPKNEFVGKTTEIVFENGSESTSISAQNGGKMEVAEAKSGRLADQSIWDQMAEIVRFSGPATGLWICGPLMSLIDTAVIGQGSSIELAALGPGTVLCDYMSYIFMFLSIATSNMVATSLARQDENEVQRQISILLFLGLSSGVLMLVFTKFLGAWALTAFTGAKNMHLLPAANTYVQIRALAWPSLLVGWVAQSAR